MPLDTQWAIRWMHEAHQLVAQYREVLIDLDRHIGDADHGENLDRGFTAVDTALRRQQWRTPGEVLNAVAKILMSTVGGASGSLYSAGFLKASTRLTSDSLSADDVVSLLEGVVQGIQSRGKAMPGEKTMLDAWHPALESARASAQAGAEALTALKAAASAARAGADATLDMVATKGRASYLGQRSVGHIDPGAYSSALILEAAVAAANSMEG